MAKQFSKLIGSSALVAVLSACGGGGGGEGSPGGDASAVLPKELTSLLDKSSALTDALCPVLSAGAAIGEGIDPAGCLQEGEELALPDSGYTLSLNPVVQQFCPGVASAFDATLTFQGELVDSDFLYDTDVSLDGSATFPVACLQEAAAALGDPADLLGNSNPLTDQLCPAESADGSVDPAACFAELAGQGGGGGGGGENPLSPVLEPLCPDAAEGAPDEETPLACLNEASAVYMQVYDTITERNDLTDQICPTDSADGRIDPATCFTEAAMGLGGLPGGGLPGGGDNPLAPLMEQACPTTAAGDLSPETPIQCLSEIGENFQDVQDLLTGSNPLTEQFCPAESADGNVNPAACFEEAITGGLPGGGLPGGGENPLSPLLEQACPTAAAGELGPNTPVDCLSEIGENFQDVQDLLTGSNPLTEQFCPAESADGSVDPAACFEEAITGGLPGGGLPGGGENPLSPLLEQACPAAAAGELGPNTPVDCLSEIGENFQDVQDLLTGSNPLTEQFCPAESADGSVDPAACFEEAITGGLPGGGLPGGGENPLSPLLEQACPAAAAGELGPNTPVDCLSEIGENFQDVQDLLTGSNPLTEQFCPAESADGSVDPAACFEEAITGGLPGGGLPGGGENPLSPLLEQACPTAAAGELGPNTPVDCLSEIGENFQDVQDLLTGSNPLTEQFCPAESADGSVDPAACFQEAITGGLPGGGLPGGGENPLAPLLEPLCPVTAGAEVGPNTPVDCLSEAGAGLAALEELLATLSEPNPLTDQVCPNTSASGVVDPRACFIESLDNVELLNTQDIGLLPGCPLLQGNNSAGDVSLTLGLGCLLSQDTPEAPSLDADALVTLIETLLGGLQP